MNARKKAVKVKGAVLLMILAVMTVLIILLAGSIAVVYSTHNRTQLKFKESQAYYTARSMVEEFVDYMMNDTTTKSGYYETYFVKKDDGSYEKKTVELDMAGAIEMDLYKVPVYTGSQWYLDKIAACNGDADKLKEFQDSVNLTDTVINEDTNHSTFSDYYNQYKCSGWTSSCEEGVDDTITYTVDTTKTDLRSYGTDGSTVYGSLFYDNSTTVPPIKVQVLERQFDMGEGTTVAERIRNGDRRKDHMVIRVYVEVNMEDDSPVTTSIVIGSNYNPPPTNNDAIVAMGSIESNASLRSVGGTSSLFPGWIELNNNSATAGSLYFKGSVIINSTPPPTYLRDGEMMFVKDVLRLSGMPTFSSNMRAATIYAGVTELAYGGGADLGNGTTKVNLITQRFQVNEGSEQNRVHGQIFADEFVLTNGSLSNGANLSSTNAVGIMDANVYCNYLSVPDTNVTILFDEATGYAYLQLDRGPVSGNWFGLKSAGFQGEELTDSTTNRPLHNYFASGKSVKIYKGIKIINAGGKSASNHSNGTIDTNHNYKTERTDWTGAEVMVSPVKGHKYDSTFALPGQTTEEAECYEFGEIIVGPDGNNYTLALDNSVSSKYQAGSGDAKTPSDLLDLRYEIPTTDYNTAKADAASNPSKWADFRKLNLEEDFTRKLTLPAKLYKNSTTVSSEDNIINLPTERSIFGDYFFDYVGKGGPNSTNQNGYHADIEYSISSLEYNSNVTKEWLDGVGVHDGDKEHKSPTGANWDGYTWTHNGTFNLDLSASYDDDPSNDKVNFTNKNERIAYIKSRIIPSEILLGDNFNFSLVKYTAEAPTAISDGSEVNGITIPAGETVITGNGILPTSHSGTYYIDARTNSVELQIGTGSVPPYSWGNYQITGEFVVVGSEQVSIFVVGNGKANETISLGSTGNGYAQWTAPIKPSSANIYVQGATPETPSPNVTYYVAQNIKEVQLYEGGSVGTVLCGTFFAPTSYANFSTSMNATNANRTIYYGPNGDIGNIGNFKSYVFGNIICSQLTMGQHAGVTFIPNQEPPPYGSKKINFNGVGASR